MAALADRETGADAAHALAQIGGFNCTVALVAALTAGRSSLEAAALRGLGQLGDPAAIDLIFANPSWELEQASREGVEEERAQLLARLTGVIGPPAFARLVAQLEHQHLGARLLAVRALASMGGAEATGSLLTALRDSSRQVRSQVMWVLGKLRASEAVEPIAALIDTDEAGAALAALREIGDQRAVQVLVEALSHQSSFVRNQAAVALGGLRWEPANDDQRIAFSLAEIPKRHPAAKDLGPAAEGRLLEFLRDESRDVRQDSARVLGELGSAKAVEPLTVLLEDSHEPVRWAAASALGSIGDPLAVNGLLRALSSATGSGELEAVIRALGAIGDGRAFGDILSTLRAEERLDETVRALIAADSVAALEGILRTSPATVSTDALEAASGLRELPQAELDSRGWPQWKGPLDCSELRTLAAEELRRRP